jgi:raffinose/stachyose/melibiose transport system substrate-binding protein
MKRATLFAIAAVAALTLGACTSKSGARPADVNPSGQIKPRQISWLLSRPPDGSVVTVMSELASEYAKTHPGFSLKLISTPDRPSYIQKYETLAAANKLPELFDTDATPFAEKLAKQGRMVQVDTLLKDLGVYANYRPNALNYQRFDDGSLYMIPFEYQLEFFWYNKALFKRAGVSVPTSLDDLPTVCKALRRAGVTPIAVDGQDGWPLERYIAYRPFRQAGPSYIKSLKKAQASLSDPAGANAAQWLSALGSAQCFEQGFSATGYADAQALFTSGKAAMYNIGTWELSNLATTKLSPTVRADVDFFTLPTIPSAVTAANEYVSPSGIGMAVNAKTYDPLVRDFLKFALTNYPARYAALGNLSPTTNAPTVIPQDATPLYKKAIDAANTVGSQIAMPWDTQLDPTSNNRLVQDLPLLIQGNITPQQFISTIDSTIKQNAPRYFQ